MKKKFTKHLFFCAVVFIFVASLVVASGTMDNETKSVESESTEELQSTESASDEEQNTEGDAGVSESTEIAEDTESESTAEDTKPKITPEIAFMDSDGKLRRYAYDDETTAMLSSGGPLHLISGSADTFVQTRYNARGQLITRAVWKTGAEENSEPVRDSFTEFFYSASSERPEKRLVTTSASQEETLYLTNGKESRVSAYKIDGDKKELVSVTNYRYDANGKPAGTTKTTPPKPTALDTAADSETEISPDEEIRYQYTENSVNANTEYIKDGKIIMKTEYESDTRRTETRYFDFDLSVETTYENDVIILERFMQGDREIRTTSFE
jgi:hypothetical protein